MSLRVERQCSLDLLGVPVQVMTKSTNTGQETEGVSSSMRAGKSWRDLSEPGIVPPGFRLPTFGQSMDSLLAAQLMKDALCEAIQGGNVRLQEVLAPHPCPRPALLRHTHAPRAPDPQLGSIAAGCAGRRPLPAATERVDRVAVAAHPPNQEPPMPPTAPRALTSRVFARSAPQPTMDARLAEWLQGP